MKRRQILKGVVQASAGAIGSVGLTDLLQNRRVLAQVQRYDRLLAQGKPGRKLALLMGINGYPESAGPLQGCLHDVELQWELLVHRYGFMPQDILVLADRPLGCLTETPLRPTRQNFVEAFERHLIRQATADSTVVFFYSGHGALIGDDQPLPSLTTIGLNGQMIQETNANRVQGALVTLGADADSIDFVSARSLFLLTYQLSQKTKNFTSCLDSCYSGGSFRAAQPYRLKVARQSLDTLSQAQNQSPALYPMVQGADLEDQKRWLRSLNLTSDDFQTLRRKGIAAGVAIGSAQHNQISADVPFDGGRCSAGALNYTLTRYLWQQPLTESMRTVFGQIARRTQDLSAQVLSPAQVPIALSQNASDLDRPIYLLEPQAAHADAVVRQVQDAQVTYWLGGVSIASLEGDLTGTLFEALNTRGEPVAQIRHQSRAGFVGSGILVSGDRSALQRGTLLRERSRLLPSQPSLRVGLDLSLGTDVSPAKQALKALGSQVTIEGENQTIEARLIKVTPELQQAWQTVAPKLQVGQVGLARSNGLPMVPSFGAVGEPIEAAVVRLTKTFKSLLAAKVLRSLGQVDLLTGTTGKTIAVTIEVAMGKVGKQIAPATFTPKSSLAVKVQNQSDRSLYIGIVVISASGHLRVLYPYVGEFESAESRALLGAGETLQLPDRDWEFNLSGTPGTLELLVFASPQPIKLALKGLQSIARGRRGGTTARFAGLSAESLSGEDALATVGALLSDLVSHRRSGSTVNAQPVNAQPVGAIESDQFEILSLPISVVAASHSKEP